MTLTIEYIGDTEVIRKVKKNSKTIYDKEKREKEIAKKTIEALESTNARDSNASQKAKDRLEQIW